MSEPAKNRYYNISNASFGETTFNTVEMIELQQNTVEIADAGDTDTGDSFLAKGRETTRYTIRMKDPVQAKALQTVDTYETLKFDGLAGPGGTPVHVEIANCLMFNLGNTAAYERVWNQTVTGRAFNPDGSDPVTIEPAGSGE